MQEEIKWVTQDSLGKPVSETENKLKIRKQNNIQTWQIEEFRPETGGHVFKEVSLSTEQLVEVGG